MSEKKEKKQNRATFAKGILRRASFQWKPRYEALKLSRVSRGLYKCSACEDLFKSTEVEIDHIYPVVDPKVGFTTFDDYIEKLFCPVELFAILCVQCHKNKTMREDLMREHYKTVAEKLPELKVNKFASKKKLAAETKKQKEDEETD